MPFDWNEYLSIAKSLKAKTDGQAHSASNEAMQRTAISRAYYSMFHLAVDYAKANLGYTPQQGGPNQSHTDIRTVYQRQLANPDHQEVKKMLARLHKARLNSDYKSESLGNTEKLLESVILDADRMKVILST